MPANKVGLESPLYQLAVEKRDMKKADEKYIQGLGIVYDLNIPEKLFTSRIGFSLGISHAIPFPSIPSDGGCVFFER
jgi:hypothetical protein